MVELRRLSGLGPGRAAELARIWSVFPVERRRQIVVSLVELAEDNIELDFGAVLKVCLSDPDEEIRSRAIEGLWEDEETSTAQRFLEMLERDPSAKVRETAAVGLGPFAYRAEIGELSAGASERVRRCLLAAVDRTGEPVDVRRRAVESLAFFSTPETHRLIERAYDDADPKMRASAVFAMGRNCDAGWLETVVGELKSPSSEMRFEAARAAGELEDERCVRPLVPLLVDPDPEVRLAVIASLGSIGGPTARRALEYAAKNGDDVAKSAAAEVLGEMSLSDGPIGLHPLIPDEKLN